MPTPLLLDGGMGHELKARCAGRAVRAATASTTDGGAWLDDTFLGPLLANAHAPDLVEAVHREYVAAGSSVLTTNTFVCTRHHLRKVGLENCRDSQKKRILNQK